jgi:cell division septum initiation protein DivIVA
VLVPIEDEDFDLSRLPRNPFGGVKAEAVSDLLKRAAWEHRKMRGRDEQLSRSVEELTRRTAELEVQVASLEAVAAERREPDELALALLASARRSARELRESARREGELLLKKARERAREIGGGAQKRASANLTKLEEVRAQIIADLRSTLEALVDLGRDESHEGAQELVAGEPDHAFRLGESVVTGPPNPHPERRAVTLRFPSS